VTNSFFEFLDADTTRQPFFAHVQYYAAHSPYTAIAAFDSLFVDDEFYQGLGDAPGFTTQSCVGGITAGVARDGILDMDYYVAQYDAMIAQSDFELSRIFQGLESRGILDSTLVILTADHGELLAGEHGRYFCHNTFYEGNNHVPMVIWLPEAWLSQHPGFHGIWVDFTISHVDLMPSTLDFLSLPVPAQAQGLSLFSGGYGQPAALGATANFRAAVRHGEKLIHAGRGLRLSSKLELYDLVQDPEELFNLAADDSSRTLQQSTAMLNEARRLRDIDIPWEPDTTYYQDDFEDREVSGSRLFIAYTDPAIWNWKRGTDPLDPLNHMLYGYAVDTTQVMDDNWITGTCAVIGSPRGKQAVELDLNLWAGSVDVRAAWMPWAKTGFVMHFTPDGVSLKVHVPDMEDRLVGEHAQPFTLGEWHHVRFQLRENEVQVDLDGAPIIQGRVPAWEELYGIVEFAFADRPVHVGFDNLVISSD